MPFVTVKPKFQVTISAKLCRGMDLRDGDPRRRRCEPDLGPFCAVPVTETQPTLGVGVGE